MFDVMAIGNALVDHEYLLEEEQLATLPLNKGSMTLASADEQRDLLEGFKAQNIAPSKQTGGGAAANAVFAISSLGAKPFYACRVGDDEAGRFYINDLQQAGVTTADNSVATGTTGSCVVVITPDGERTMQTFLGASSDVNEENIHFDALNNSSWLYFEGYLAMAEGFRPSIIQLQQQARDTNTKIAVSFADPAVVNFAKEGLLAMLTGGVDVIFCNSEEALTFTEADTIEQAARALTEYCQLAVVTDGGNDVIICEKQSSGELIITAAPTPSVTKIIDTNGAGDNYSGAFLYALNQKLPLLTCARLAGAVSSEVIEQFGPRLSVTQYQDIAKSVL